MSNQGFHGVIQFVHPGHEHKAKSTWQHWTLGSHARKFMLNHGEWMDSNLVTHAGEMTFWGEWEGPSEVISSWSFEKGLPRHLVTPHYWGPTISVPGLMNTDPYVFGSEFKYTLCKQSQRKGNSTYLAKLQPGTLVLFGSVVKGFFCLDTAFVVGPTIIEHSRATWENEVLPHISPTYKAVTLDPMYWDPNVPDSVTYKLYHGATSTGTHNGMFSFFPCLPSNSNPERFERPVIELPNVINHNSKQAPKGTQGDETMIKKCWDSIVEQVFSQGLSLGVNATEPLLTNRPEEISESPQRKRK